MPQHSTTFSRSPFLPARSNRSIACAAALMSALVLPAASARCFAQSINDQRPARIVAAPAPLVDINRAGVAQLMRVHGITLSYAQRIIGGRPYANKAQLTTKGILPPAVYEAAKERLIAHHMR